MSYKRKIEIICPCCHKKDYMTIWDSININSNPELKKSILNGELFDYKCKDCKTVTKTEHNLLYHDMDKNLMIAVANDDKYIQEILKEFRKFDNTRNLLGSNDKYTYRIVRNNDELKEKIMIFDTNISDKTIEFAKLLTKRHLQEEKPDLKIDRLFFNINNANQYKFDFFSNNKKIGNCNLVDDALKFASMCKFDEISGGYFINEEWIFDILHEKNIHDYDLYNANADYEIIKEIYNHIKLCIEGIEKSNDEQMYIDIVYNDNLSLVSTFAYIGFVILLFKFGTLNDEIIEEYAKFVLENFDDSEWDDASADNLRKEKTYINTVYNMISEYNNKYISIHPNDTKLSILKLDQETFSELNRLFFEQTNRNELSFDAILSFKLTSYVYAGIKSYSETIRKH